ncbi:hypothetical protein FE257_013028 [Aspergillus nanangensis]|uniref:Uncharacterized protein n=1 Tax=Aspergillus nanangensis TaxID=2582783 RepID=A0AAD4GQA7_ASPNN|nr:hypothetical protein FE257_013028 [Aspergillus nanangensis]
MEWPINSSQRRRDQLQGSLSTDPFSFPIPTPGSTQGIASISTEPTISHSSPNHGFPNDANINTWAPTSSGLNHSLAAMDAHLQNHSQGPCHPDLRDSACVQPSILDDFLHPRTFPFHNLMNIDGNTNVNTSSIASGRDVARQQPVEPSLGSAPNLQCKWQGCRSSTRFNRVNDLIRHIKTIHISPSAYPCLEDNCSCLGFLTVMMLSYLRSLWLQICSILYLSAAVFAEDDPKYDPTSNFRPQNVTDLTVLYSWVGSGSSVVDFPSLEVKFDDQSANLTLDGYYYADTHVKPTPDDGPDGQLTSSPNKAVGHVQMRFHGVLDAYHSDVLVLNSLTPSWLRTVGFGNNSANVGYGSGGSVLNVPWVGGVGVAFFVVVVMVL